MINYFYIFCLLMLSLPYIKNAMHMFQQNRYEFYRYTKWLFSFKNIHFSVSIIFVLAMLVIGFFDFDYAKTIISIACLIFGIYLLYLDTKKEYIKPLVFTQRVKRTMFVYLILELVLINLLYYHLSYHIVAIVCVFMPYLSIYLAFVLMMPVEKAIKNHYINEARNILNDMSDLKTIGITGSFGKTSVKNIVHDIMNESFYTLMTPASYNTPMGITITVREYLKPIHEVFVCEMGADHVGEITYLMNFVKPKYGVVTSIGPQHLNTFHNIENIINEKMQAIELLPSDGVGILNVDNEYIANYKVKNNCRLIKVAIHNTKGADYVAKDIAYNKRGSSFVIEKDDKEYHYETILLGEHNVMNILIAVAIAHEMGVSMEKTVSAVRNVKQVEHRLEIKNINGYTFIDNAFNSNPVSSKHSLDVLKNMEGMRVIITPGLIDLGKDEFAYNKEFGKYMLNRCDVVLLVGPKQTEAIRLGLEEVGFNNNDVHTFDSVKEAFNYVYTNLPKNATVLLENDLPDAFSK